MNFLLDKICRRLNHLKRGPKALVIFFLSVFILQMVLMLFWLMLPQSARAEGLIPENMKFKPSISIPGSEFQAGQEVTLTNDTAPIGRYIRAIYNYGVAVVGILAAIILMVSGIVWLTAAGNEKQIEEARSWMKGSISGLVLVLTSYIIFRTINPDIVNFKVADVQAIREHAFLECCSPNGITKVEVEVDPSGKRLYISGEKKGQMANCADFGSGQECESGSVCVGIESTYQCLKGNKDTETCASGSGYCLVTQTTPDGYNEDGDQCFTNGNPPALGYCYRSVNWLGGACGNEGGVCTLSSLGCNRPGYGRDRGGSSCGSNLVCCKKQALLGEPCGGGNLGRCYDTNWADQCPAILGLESIGGGIDCDAGLYCCMPATSR